MALSISYSPLHSSMTSNDELFLLVWRIICSSWKRKNLALLFPMSIMRFNTVGVNCPKILYATAFGPFS